MTAKAAKNNAEADTKEEEESEFVSVPIADAVDGGSQSTELHQGTEPDASRSSSSSQIVEQETAAPLGRDLATRNPEEDKLSEHHLGIIHGHQQVEEPPGDERFHEPAMPMEALSLASHTLSSSSNCTIGITNTKAASDNEESHQIIHGPTMKTIEESLLEHHQHQQHADRGDEDEEDNDNKRLNVAQATGFETDSATQVAAAVVEIVGVDQATEGELYHGQPGDAGTVDEANRKWPDNGEGEQLVEQPGVVGARGGRPGAKGVSDDQLEPGESQRMECKRRQQQQQQHREPDEAGVEFDGQVEALEQGIEIDGQQVVCSNESIAKHTEQQVNFSPTPTQPEVVLDGEEEEQKYQCPAPGDIHTPGNSSPYCSISTSSSVSSFEPLEEEEFAATDDHNSLPPADQQEPPIGNSMAPESVIVDDCARGSSNINIDEDLAADGQDTDSASEDDFCNESASSQNLRQLKMDASRDVQVCEMNRDSMEAARSLFETLSRHQRNHTSKQAHQQQVSAAKKSSSLSSSSSSSTSSSSSAGQAQLDGGDSINNNGLRHASSINCTRSDSTVAGDEIYDIKIIKRSGSSVSASGFRRTLVCSVSPTSQMGGGSSSDTSLQDAGQPVYPIDGDEMQQCKAAFRENKRLIERQQETCKQTNGIAMGTPPIKQTSEQSCETTCNWTLRNKSLMSNLPNCTHCKKKLYPVDKIELDFTRATLNIHRNCFKCQICSSMLRLETYAAIDAKLYCPAHVKCVTTAR